MKKHTMYKKVCLGLIAPALMIIVTLVSCDDNPTKVTNSTAPPNLERVSLLNKDSTTTSGRRGGRYLIIGKHLKGARSVTINGQGVYLNQPFITDNNIVVQVPDSTPVLEANIPDSVFNKIVVTTNKGSASLPFHISVTPDIQSFLPEIGDSGTVVTIKGNFFDNLKDVKVGKTSVNVLSSSEDSIQVKIPDSSTQGKITVATADGKSITGTGFLIPKQIAYYDGIPTDWYVNGYGQTQIDLKNENKKFIKSGQYSMKVTFKDAYGGFDVEDYDANSPIPLNGSDAIRFTVYRDQGASQLTIDLEGNFDAGKVITLPKGQYKTFTIPVSELGSPSSFRFMEIYSGVSDVPSVIYINDISIL